MRKINEGKNKNVIKYTKNSPLKTLGNEKEGKKINDFRSLPSPLTPLQKEEGKKIKDFRKVKEFVKNCLEAMMHENNNIDHNKNQLPEGSKYSFIELLNLACRWAELELRSKRNMIEK